MELLLNSLESCTRITCLSLFCPSSTINSFLKMSKEDFFSRLIRLIDKLEQLVALFCYLNVPFIKTFIIKTLKRVIKFSLRGSRRSGQHFVSTSKLGYIIGLNGFLIERCSTILKNFPACTTIFSLVVKIRWLSSRTVITHSFGEIYKFSICQVFC